MPAVEEVLVERCGLRQLVAVAPVGLALAVVEAPASLRV